MFKIHPIPAGPSAVKPVCSGVSSAESLVAVLLLSTLISILTGMSLQIQQVWKEISQLLRLNSSRNAGISTYAGSHHGSENRLRPTIRACCF
jgi:hypothetical protein